MTEPEHPDGFGYTEQGYREWKRAHVRDWPAPTPELLSDPRFDAVMDCIRDWDIAVPYAYGGYCAATGNHVRAILDALASAK